MNFHPSVSSRRLVNPYPTSMKTLLGERQMNLEHIYEFFRNRPPTYLGQELAVCYVLSVLVEKESYGTELISLLETEHPRYRLSDTVLYSAIKFLEDEKAITGYWKKVQGRGRPRRMYQISSQWQTLSQDLARLWREYITTNPG